MFKALHEIYSHVEVWSAQKDTYKSATLSNETSVVETLEVATRYIYSEYGVLKNLRTNATALINSPLATQIAHNQPLRYAGYVYDECSQMYYWE